MQKKILKITALLITAVLLTGLGIFANSLFGNPISRMLARKAVKSHLAQRYGNTDFYMERLGFNFKTSDYYAIIKSSSSIDSDFTLSIKMDGTLRYDDYEDRVTARYNTANRLNEEYRQLTLAVLDDPDVSYVSNIDYGVLEFVAEKYQNSPDVAPYAMIQEDLELDRSYDVRELAKTIGHLVVYVEDKTVTPERASEILLEIKERMDAGGVPFYAINFVLEYPRAEDGSQREGRVEAIHFLYSDIYEEGLPERVAAANEAAMMYWEEMEKQK